MDVGIIHREVTSIIEFQSVGTTAIEVTVIDIDTPTTLHADDSAQTVSALGVTDSQVLDVYLLTVLEIQ